MLVAIQPPRGFGDDPIARLPLARPAAAPPLPGLLPLARQGLGRRRHRPPRASTARSSGCRARPSALSAGCWPDAALGDVPFFYPFVVNDPGEGTQAKRRAHAVIVDHLAAADDPGRDLRRAGPARAAARRVRPGRRRSTRPSCPRSARQVWDLLVEAEIAPRPRRSTTTARPGDDDFDDMILHVDGYLCALKDAQIRGGLHVLGLAARGRGAGRPRAGHHPPAPGRPCRRCGRPSPATSASTSPPSAATRSTRSRPSAASGSRRWPPGTGRSTPRSARLATSTTRPSTRPCAGSCERLVPALRAHARRDRQPAAPASTAATCPPGRAARRPAAAPTCCRPGATSTRSTPRRCPSPLAWEVGRALADALLERHVAETGAPPRTVGLVLWGTATMRTRATTWPRRWRCSACARCGTDESGRVDGPRGDPARRAGPAPRRRDAAHLGLLPRRLPPRRRPARRRGAARRPGSTSRPRTTRSGPPAPPTPASSGRRPAATASGILPVIERRATGAPTPTWPRSTWPGRASPTGAAGSASPPPTRCAAGSRPSTWRSRTRTTASTTSSTPTTTSRTTAAWSPPSGPSPAGPHGVVRRHADPAGPAVRALAEEAARVVRTRVLNPQWIDAMRRHGYKGAFEMAATVDYLFGYDATAHVVEDWMYERVTEAYVGRPGDAEVLRAVEPVGAALHRRAAARGRPSAACGTPATGARTTLRRRGARGRGLGGGRT